MSAPTRVLFVCLGNICRSPLAEGVFRHQAEAAGLGRAFEVASAGTSAWHVGEPPDPGSVRVARQHGVEIGHQRARLLTAADLARFDVVVAMDRSNHRNIVALHGGRSLGSGRLWLLRNFEEAADGAGDDLDVPDPWGGGPEGFAEVYRIVARSCAHLLRALTGRARPQP
jgi:protein-tyrosine phosphatase